MRDRLIESLGDFPVWHSTLKDKWMPEAIERLADHLLANGVIVPPFSAKVGNKVYRILCRGYKDFLFVKKQFG